MATVTTVLDDYQFDFTNTTIYHIDLVLNYDTNIGTAPSLFDYIRDATTGATAKVIGGTDLGGTAATGSLTLSRVRGRFGNNNHLDVLDTLGFDTVDDTKLGISIGDSIDGPTTEDFDVHQIEFNWPGMTTGSGVLYGTIQVAGWLNNDAIDNTTNGESSVALATGAETDNSALFTTAVVNEPTDITGAGTTLSGIIHYDAGTIDLATDADIYNGTRDTATLTSTGTAPANNDTVTLGTTVYTFKTTLTPAVNEVLIGASALTAIRNLASAINLTGVIGTDYANGTVKNTLATARITSATTLIADSIKPNPAADTIASADTGTELSWSATSLSGGTGGTGSGNNFGRTATSVTATGSIILNDLDGTWADGDSLYMDGFFTYDNIQTGQKFKIGDVVKGTTSLARGRIIALPTVSTNMVLAEQTGRFEENEQLHTVARNEATTYVADMNGSDGLTSVCATINHPNSAPCPRTRQSDELQGGIYDDSVGINNIRRSRTFFNMLMSRFADDFDLFDDKVPADGSVKNGAYRLKNSWFMPDENFNYLTTGAWTDETSENIWANPQVIGTQFRINTGGLGNLQVAPQIYGSQDGDIIAPFWLEGGLDINIKIKTTTAPKYTTATEGEGASIDNGQLTIYNRFKTHTYSTSRTPVNTTGGVVTVALGTQNDLQDVTETHDFAYDNGIGTWVAGEEIVSQTTTEVVGVVVSADTGATGNVQYILKSGTNFANNDVVTGQTSQVSKDVNGAPTTVVAGYNDKIGFGHVNANFTGGSTSGTFQIGEGVTQTGGFTGIILEDDNDTLYIDELTGTWNGTDTITGDLSGATYTPTSRASDTVAPKDIGDEVDNDYGCIFGLDKTASGSGRTILEFYEYTKYITAKEADSTIQLQDGRGTGTAVEGRFYRSVDTTFTEVTAAPYGIMGGPDLFIGAQSVFVQDMAAADLQKVSLTDDAGTGESPPNIRTLTFDQVASGDKLSVFRTTTGETIATGEWAVDTVGSGQNQSADTIINVANGTGVGARTLTSGTDLPNDIPTTGTIRCEDPNNAGLFLSFQYSSRVKTGANAADFNLATNARQPTPDIGDITSSTDLVAGDDVHVMLMQATATTTSEAVSIEHVSNINFLGILRKRGINPFRVTGTFNGTAGATITAVRQDDPVVDPL